MKKGTLFAIGTGPGAADLLTVRAVAILEKTKVILAAASPKNDYSASLETVKQYTRPDARLERLDFPMTFDKSMLDTAWRKAARQTLDILNNGEDAVFLTVGDPLIYSTFIYLMRTLQELDPEINVVIVPGITSFQAAAARCRMPLCDGGGSLNIISGIGSAHKLKQELENAGCAVLLKVYRNFPAIMEALEHSGRLDNAVLVSMAEREGEQIIQLANYTGTHPPYMSLVISPAARNKKQG